MAAADCREVTRSRLEAVFGDLELPVAVHESPGHFAEQIGFGHIGAIRLFVKRLVAFQVLLPVRD